MCRHLAYLGPPITLHDLLLKPDHSLLRQSWTPRMQKHGKINADGFGVGWWDHTRRSEPARYRRAVPMWTDRSFASIAGLISSTSIVAAVRSATPPAAAEESGTAPFAAGPWLFSHNGAVPDTPALRTKVSQARAAAIEGSSDSEVLFALALDQLDDGRGPAAALAATVALAADGRRNLLLSDGHRIAATACGDTLFVRHDGGAVVVASEPFDKHPSWEQVPDGSLVDISSASLTVTPL